MPKGQSKWTILRNLQQDEERQNKNTTQYVLDTTIHLMDVKQYMHVQMYMYTSQLSNVQNRINNR